MSSPRLVWPVGEPVAPRSPSSLRTMAVDDSETSRPVNRAARSSTPASSSTPVVTPTAEKTCSDPPSSTSRRMAMSRPIENSMPIVNSSRMTPSSAAASMTSRSRTTPSAFGPIRTPASRKPTIGTMRSRAQR